MYKLLMKNDVKIKTKFWIYDKSIQVFIILFSIKQTYS